MTLKEDQQKEREKQNKANQKAQDAWGAAPVDESEKRIKEAAPKKK